MLHPFRAWGLLRPDDRNVDGFIDGMIEDDIFDACSSECDGYINISGFSPPLYAAGK